MPAIFQTGIRFGKQKPEGDRKGAPFTQERTSPVGIEFQRVQQFMRRHELIPPAEGLTSIDSCVSKRAARFSLSLSRARNYS